MSDYRESALRIAELELASDLLRTGHTANELVAVVELEDVTRLRRLGHAAANLIRKETYDASLNGHHPVRERLEVIDSEPDQQKRILGSSAIFFANDYISTMDLGYVENKARFDATQDADMAMLAVVQNLNMRPDLVDVVPKSEADRKLYILPDTLSPDGLVAGWTHRRMFTTGPYNTRLRNPENPREIIEKPMVVEGIKRSSFVINIGDTALKHAPSLVTEIRGELEELYRRTVQAEKDGQDPSLVSGHGQLFRIHKPESMNDISRIFAAKQPEVEADRDDWRRDILLPVDTTYIGVRQPYEDYTKDRYEPAEDEKAAIESAIGHRPRYVYESRNMFRVPDLDSKQQEELAEHLREVAYNLAEAAEMDRYIINPGASTDNYRSKRILSLSETA